MIKIFYHGTSSKNLKSILKIGLLPGNGRNYQEDIWLKNHCQKGVFMDAQASVAQHYAEIAAGKYIPNSQLGQPVILAVRINPKRLHRDIAAGGAAYFCTSRIPPKHIKKI
jgi:hypothetical protein